MKRYRMVPFIFAVILCFSCTASNQSAGSRKVTRSTNTTSSATIETQNQAQSLFDYLRRVPGLQVSGTESNPTILVRNSPSLQPGANRPLFVIDGRPVGNDYNQAASIVDVNDIKSVTVLKDVASTSAYGLRGANGVIVIRTKTGRDR